jgi:hypothetical protein
MTDASQSWGGVPQNPERDGWHWLLNADGVGDPFPMLWDADGKMWDAGDAGWMLAEEVAVRRTYLGPCLTPADAIERNAAVAARDEAIREMSRQARVAGAMEAQRDHLRAVMREVRSLMDRHMGDTDPQDPDHPLLRACQMLSHALGDAP